MILSPGDCEKYLGMFQKAELTIGAVDLAVSLATLVYFVHRRRKKDWSLQQRNLMTLDNFLWKIAMVAAFSAGITCCPLLQHYLPTQAWPGFVLNQLSRYTHVFFHNMLLVWYTFEQFYESKTLYLCNFDYAARPKVNDING